MWETDMKAMKPEGHPAILSIVEEKWLILANEEFRKGRSVIHFSAKTSLGLSKDAPTIRHVYFKTHGVNIVARADAAGVTDANPRATRLPGSEDELGKFYYGFSMLQWIEPIPLARLKFYNTGNPVPNDHPGTRLVQELPLGEFRERRV
jgi:hypothetical protein